MTFTRSDDRNKSDWLSCPECGSDKVSVDKGDGWTPAILFDCRKCSARNSYYL